MNHTGFSPARASEHDALIAPLIVGLEQRGYRPKRRELDGDEPDVEIFDHVRFCIALVDLKVPRPDQDRYALKQGALESYWRITINRAPVYIVWITAGGAYVDNVFTLSTRIVGGPHRATPNGSSTDWLLFERGGTPFDKFFPAQLAAV